MQERPAFRAAYVRKAIGKTTSGKGEDLGRIGLDA
jgi:hypothetical protein